MVGLFLITVRPRLLGVIKPAHWDKGGVVFSCCHNTLLQTQALEATHIDYGTAWGGWLSPCSEPHKAGWCQWDYILSWRLCGKGIPSLLIQVVAWTLFLGGFRTEVSISLLKEGWSQLREPLAVLWLVAPLLHLQTHHPWVTPSH